MKQIIDKKLCNGCATCSLVCPKKCISMAMDNEGFLRPVIDGKECIDCKLCKKTCPVLNKKEQEKKCVRAYAVKNRDENVRQSSSSGGVFTQLAKYVLRKQGAVFGAAFDDDFVVKHISVENEKDLAKLRKSKYVQSQIGESYKLAKNLLEQGKIVLFTGTPCQIGGLQAYLRKPYKNLITQDIICHGVPSPKVWKKYLEKKKAKGQIKNVSFKDKSTGWRSYSLTFDYDDKKDSELISKNLFMNLFLKNVILRESCYNCAFKDEFRDSDITLADFWGVENVNVDFSDDKGVSLVILNTQKGKEIFNSIRDGLIFEETDFEKALNYNKSMTASAMPNPNREKFFKNLDKCDVEKLAKKITRQSFFNILKTKTRKIIRRIYSVFCKIFKNS